MQLAGTAAVEYSSLWLTESAGNFLFGSQDSATYVNKNGENIHIYLKYTVNINICIKNVRRYLFSLTTLTSTGGAG